MRPTTRGACRATRAGNRTPRRFRDRGRFRCHWSEPTANGVRPAEFEEKEQIKNQVMEDEEHEEDSKDEEFGKC